MNIEFLEMIEWMRIDNEYLDFEDDGMEGEAGNERSDFPSDEEVGWIWAVRYVSPIMVKVSFPPPPHPLIGNI